jgi:hypothetical protein
MTIRYNWGRLNSILAPFSLRYYDQSTTSWAGTLNRVLDNSFSADAFSAQGRIKAICLRVEATPFAPADSWVKQVYTDNEDSAKLWLSVKARIPELHSHLCDPFAIDVQREYCCGGIHGLIEMYPTFLSRFPLGENGFTSVPAAGEIIEVDFDDRKNFTNPTYIGRIGTANLVDGNLSASPGVANTFKESLSNADLRITDGETGAGLPGNSELTTPKADIEDGSKWLRSDIEDSSKWTQKKKLESMNKAFAQKVELIIKRLRVRGFQPKIFFGWRSLSAQRHLFNRGKSKLLFSFHTATLNDKPNSYAADIIDRRWGWTKGNVYQRESFWAALGEEARKEGLIWGGDWTGFKDLAHVQFYPNSKLSKIKKESNYYAQ